MDKTWTHARSRRAAEFTARPTAIPECLLNRAASAEVSGLIPHLLDLKRTMLNIDLSLKAKQFKDTKISE